MKILFSHADIIATEADAFRIYRDAFLAVDGDTISYIGEKKPEQVYDRVIDARGKLLMPGLVNAHGHTAMTLLRGVGSDLALQDWLFKEMIPVENRMRPEDIHAGMELAHLEMIATGTTSYTDMYMEPFFEAELAGRTGLRCNIARVMQGFDPNETYEDNGRGREAVQLFEQYNGAFDGRVKVDFSIHGEYTSQPHLVEAYAKDAKERGVCMHIHMSETRAEHEGCIERYGKTPAAWFYDLGVFDSPTLAAHCVWVSDEDMKLMKEKGVTAIHNPSSNMKLGSGYAPIQKMLDMGINVALGTDGCASNNNLNMFEEMHLAALIHNGYHGDPTIMKAADILKMATVNGARAQGRFDTGSLEAGKKADIIALDLSAPHLRPNLDPLALVVYSAQGSDVCMTMVNGQILYEDGNYLTMDKDEVYRHVEEAQKYLYHN